ncbi:uncharacterized protein LOC119074891 isoform X2 [Bradysia coprophila]|uniref:uncharacterized protein LOC119074891 isoform X2 n=1 Tax=Bradysia coprophila TaxID=38358 RepID=UPI00187DB13D|nr:uncharacterized protein LOC119074891 isoform X2 [Bradysia coprophila]
MTKLLGVIVLSLAVCTATSLSVKPQVVGVNEVDTKSVVDDSIRNLLESLRYSLRCGFPDQGIPPLAPLYIKSAEVNERGLLYNIQGNVRDFTVAGIDGYTVDTATLNVLTLRASIGITFPRISLTSLYNLDALLLRFIPIFGHGRLAFDVNDLSVQANGRMVLSLRTGRLNLTSLDVDVNMGSPFSDSTGVYDSRMLSTIFNIGFERIVQTIFNDNKENLETELENLLIPFANQYLNELTLADLVNGGIGGGTGGPHLDPDTGDLVCFADKEEEKDPSTTEYVPLPSAETSTIVNPSEPAADTSTSVNPSEPDDLTTVPDSTTERGSESDDLYDRFDHQLENSVKKLLRNAFKFM